MRSSDIIRDFEVVNLHFPRSPMRHFISIIVCSVLSVSGHANAQPKFSGVNYSGEYACEGENQKVGKYKVEVKLRLNLVASTGNFGAYEYTATTENSVKFYGNAVAIGNQLAASYYLDTVRRKVEPTTGLATIKRVSAGRWSFRNQYFEPDDFGGNYGSETCVMHKPEPVKQKKS
jgi:hypothetical protein